MSNILFEKKQHAHFSCGYINYKMTPYEGVRKYETPYALETFPIHQQTIAVRLVQGQNTIADGLYHQLTSEAHAQDPYVQQIMSSDMNLLFRKRQLFMFKAQEEEDNVEHLMIQTDPQTLAIIQLVLVYKESDNKTIHLFPKEAEVELWPWDQTKKKKLYDQMVRKICLMLYDQEPLFLKIPTRYIFHYLKSQGYETDTRQFLMLLDRVNELIKTYNPSAPEETLFLKYREFMNKEDLFIMDYFQFETKYVENVLRYHYHYQFPAEADPIDFGKAQTLKNKIVHSFRSFERYAMRGTPDPEATYTVHLEERQGKSTYFIEINQMTGDQTICLCKGIFKYVSLYRKEIPFEEREWNAYNLYQIQPPYEEEEGPEPIINRVFLDNRPTHCGDIPEIIGLESNGLIAHHLFPNVQYFALHQMDWNYGLIPKIVEHFLYKRMEKNKGRIKVNVEHLLRDLSSDMVGTTCREHTLKHYVDHINHSAHQLKLLPESKKLIRYGRKDRYFELNLSSHCTIEILHDLLEIWQ